MIIIILIILLLVCIWKWWTYRCLCHGLMYFAVIEHEWVINEEELKKILNYSIKRNVKDFFKN